MSSTLHTLSVRLPQDVYRDSSAIAKRKRTSVNALIREALQRMIAEEEDREMYDAATILGSDAEECRVEYAFAAQAEVVLRDDA